MSNSQNRIGQNTTDPQSSLLASGLDFIVSAAEHASNDEARSWKYAVLHLWHGMELLIKARLATERWYLLFSNVDEADHSKFLSGEFRSVSAIQAHKRLTQICGVEIDPNDWKRLTYLRMRSNRIKHNVAQYNSPQIRSVVLKCINFAIGFSHSQKMLDGTTEMRSQTYKINSLMTEFEQYVDERLKSIELYPDFVAEVECVSCWQEACTMDENGIMCHFCGVEIDAETLNQWMADAEAEVLYDEYEI